MKRLSRRPVIERLAAQQFAAEDALLKAHVVEVDHAAIDAGEARNLIDQGLALLGVRLSPLPSEVA